MTKSNKIKTVIRKIVREEVAMAIQEVITELKQPTSLSSNQSKKQVKNKRVVENKQYTSNTVLNDILNETVGGISKGGKESYPTMGGGTYDSSKINEIVSSQYSDIMNDDVESSNADKIVGAGAPEQIKNLFNKDYSGILKKSIEKRGRK